MEKQGAKRWRMEESNESGDQFCEEPEASPPKRLCMENNVDFGCAMMDNGFVSDEIEEEKVWDMMKLLRDEISPSSSSSGSDDTANSSNASEEFESSADKDYNFEADLEYLLGASDDELGIPSTPALDSVNESGGFLDWIGVEEAERHLMWKTWLGNGESQLELDTLSDLLFVHDLYYSF